MSCTRQSPDYIFYHLSAPGCHGALLGQTSHSRSDSTRLPDNTGFLKSVCLPEFLRRKQFPKGSPKYSWYNSQRGGMQRSQRKEVEVKSQQSGGFLPRSHRSGGRGSPVRNARGVGGGAISTSQRHWDSLTPFPGALPTAKDTLKTPPGEVEPNHIILGEGNSKERIIKLSSQ